MISFEDFSDLYSKIEGEPEFRILFIGEDDEYMLIKFVDGCSFQRCGYYDGTGEYFYDSLEELYNTKSIDDISLKDRWDDIEYICLNDSFQIQSKADIDEIKMLFKIAD